MKKNKTLAWAYKWEKLYLLWLRAHYFWPFFIFGITNRAFGFVYLPECILILLFIKKVTKVISVKKQFVLLYTALFYRVEVIEHEKSLHTMQLLSLIIMPGRHKLNGIDIVLCTKFYFSSYRTNRWTWKLKNLRDLLNALFYIYRPHFFHDIYLVFGYGLGYIDWIISSN